VDRNLANGSERRSPAARVPVVIERDGAETRTVTNPQGEFSADGFTPGEYRVRVDVPDSQHATVMPNPVVLRDARGCASVRGTITYDGRVSGRVIDSAGRPVPGLTIELTPPVRLDDPVGPERIRALTDSLGRYELRTVPPGRYVIGMNTQRSADGRRLPRLFHPGLEQLGSATRVVLSGGQRTTVADFVLPASVMPVRVTGVVLDPNGVPAAGALVYLKGPSEKDYIVGEPVLTDDTGTFTLAAFDGLEYRLFAERRTNDSRRLESSEQSLLTASSSLAPFKLILRVRY
jgi:protocatechuate 3,4-dioxygenase beta subunit